MARLNEEIDRLFENIEKELSEFAIYVKTIEEEYNNLLDPIRQTTGVLNQDSKIPSQDKKDLPDNNGTLDAIDITKVIVKRIYNLLNNFSNAIKMKERDVLCSGSEVEKYFYNQYVYQIVAYLLKILEENLSIFSGELIQTGERNASCSVPEKEEVKGPLKLRFSFFKPATLFTEDGRIYQSASNHKPEVKSVSTHCDSDHTGESSSDDSKCDHYRCHTCFEREKKKTVVLSNILKSLDTLGSVVEKLLLQFRNFTEAKAKSKQYQTLVAGNFTSSYEANARKGTDYVLKDCMKFCESCKSLLKNPEYKNVQLYTEYNKENPTWHKTHKAAIYDTLHRLEKKEELSGLNKYADGKKSHCQSEEVVHPHKKHISGNFFNTGDENLNEQRIQDPEAGTKDIAIQAFSHDRQKLTPYENRKETENSSNISAGKVKPCSCSSEKKLQRISKEEPKISKTKAHFSLPTELSAGRLSTSNKRTSTSASTLNKRTNTSALTSNKRTSTSALTSNKRISTSQRKIDSSSSSENDDVHVDSRETAYPQTIAFDVKKFSQLLKEKFTKSEGRSKSKELLGIVISSFKESSDIRYEEVDIKGDRISHSKEDIDTVEEKSDMVVDFLVDDVISVAAEIALGEKEGIGAQQDEQEQTIDLTPFESEELAKYLYPEQFGLIKNFLSATQACISCINMTEPIKTELPRGKKHSRMGVRGKKSLTDACFQCFNACQRGLTIHQCHFTLPSGVLEIRHMDDSARINVCFLKWDIIKESDDWRWQKNLFSDPTHIEIQQPATYELDPIIRVVYGQEETMVKESFGETSLRVIHDFPTMLHHAKVMEPEYGRTAKSDSMNVIKTQKKMNTMGLGYKKTVTRDITEQEFQLLHKLSRFYDIIQSFGYGRGPPLILKLRQKYQLNDAYDLLMAPSKVRLHYYKNLRVLFVSPDKTRQIISKSNFVEEDRSNELFEHFARKLFSTEAYHLFDYPSHGVRYMYLNPDTHTHPQWFAFAGTVLALAFLHQKKMDIKISDCFIKCLLDRPLVIDDLESIDPFLHEKLMWLKRNDISSRRAKMTFTVRDQVGSQTIDTELIVNGKNIAVTEKNKYRYIELALKWKLGERCLTQLKDFRRGFESVIDPCFLSTFKESELLSIIKHPPEYDVLMSEHLSGIKSVTRRGTW